MWSKTWRYATLTLVVLLGAWVYVLFTPTVDQKNGVVYYLSPGLSKATLIEELSQQQIVRHPIALSLFILPQANKELKTGEYLFPQGSSLFSIWRQITHGKGLYMRSFTIVPGTTFNQLRQALARTDTLRQITKGWSDQQVMAMLGQPNLSPEGQFFPESYYYTRGVQDLVILKRAFDLMQHRFEDAWLKRASGLPYKSSYDALITASLIEKEVRLDVERPLVASVVINRLNKNMLLQIDATVIYGLGDKYTGKIYKKDLLQDTIYNTYLHKGLPPTPIAMPGMSSIEAALHPAVSNYFYYVARGDGGHQFSQTLSQHNSAVAAAKKKVPTVTAPPLQQRKSP